MQEKKTGYLNPETGQQYQLVSGQNCLPETAYKEFMNTKEQYRKAKGVFFKHYVQSFKPDCGATPDQIHQMGVELAKQFKGYEVVIATHIDADHWHNHLIVNSVSCETSLKIQINEKGLEQLRNQSDEICQRFGVAVLPPYQKPQQRAMNQREYRVALKGESWKMKLLSAIDKAMKASRSKDQFIHNMAALGYDVKWADHYKYITYTTPDGKKCRDNRLFDGKYLKSSMEVYFDGLEQTYGNQRGNQGNSDRAVSAHLDWSQAGAMERTGAAHDNGRDRGGQEYGAHSQIAHAGEHKKTDAPRDQEASCRDRKPREISGAVFDGASQIQAGRGREEYTKDGIEPELRYDGKDGNAGFVPDKAKSQVGADWGDIAGNAIALAASIEAMVEEPKREQKKKKVVHQNAASKQQRQKKTHDRGWEMER